MEQAMTFTTTRFLSVLMLAAVAVPAVAAAAPLANDTQVAVVSTTGLDISKPSDQATLRHRIAVAAHQVCGQVMQGDMLTSPGYAECFGRATSDAKAQLDARTAAVSGKAVVASIAQ